MRRRAFTMIELMMVMAIIGILLSFILVAAMNASRAAEERATQALIAKLDSGLGDRIDALLTNKANPGDWGQGAGANQWCMPNGPPSSTSPVDRGSFLRAGVLARYEQLKVEIPDVFVVAYTGSGQVPLYPLNFAMTPYYVNFTAQQANDADVQSVYPIGTGVPARFTPNNVPVVGQGIWGVSYPNLAAMNMNLGKFVDPNTGQTRPGFIAKGYDMIDSNGDGFVDDIGESGGDGSIATALNSHNHVTARAEALYAFLVEGKGVYGSVFNRDDFTNREVRDTDLDGLPEFVDAWGKPLQFYRWPIFYHSDVQRGLSLAMTGAQGVHDPNQNAAYGITDAGGNVMTPYGRGALVAGNFTGALDTREQDPLDQNQQILEPAWWCAGQNAQSSPPLFAPNATIGFSGAAGYFQTYFHQLVEPLASPGALDKTPCAAQRYWDRSIPGNSFATLYPRRAFYTRFLILSAGPDGNPGTPFLTDKRFDPVNDKAMFDDATLKAFAASNPTGAAAALMLESQAAQASLKRSADGFMMPSTTNPAYPTEGDYYTNALQADGQDDITNHNLNSTALPVR